ncbi:peptide ligase PGM1-related protein [Paenarthrobacter sp. OM7]|uniref:preATP grasp domain-containing protein n=1 Tax=Paenarthrobacter sp. OM7 TaxID=3041264 RepID=UPI002468D5E2|nr:peptide ligase PGM1-related protein [Paenarthrobacter sp. OM7]WGM18769.1 peptide ligase PGM1-related protein [Paenarthrobacter sp. OM7]
MTKAIFATFRLESSVGDYAKRGASWWAQRSIWLAAEGDTLILPGPPDQAWLDYATALMGFESSTLNVLVAPPANDGETARLSLERLRNPRFLRKMKRELPSSTSRVVSCVSDPGIARLVSELELEHCLPGHEYIMQGGAWLAESKTTFRALAAAQGIPISEGTVSHSPEDALDVVLEFLAHGKSVMLKHPYKSSGAGNYILTSNTELDPVGSNHVSVLAGDRGEALRVLQDLWPALSQDGRFLVVVEEYHENAKAFFAEFSVTDQEILLQTTGELFSRPVGDAQALPATSLTADQANELVAHGRKLCESYQKMGYRGPASADAILLANGTLLFTECNCCVTGTTPTYEGVGFRVVGREYFPKDRVIYERVDWRVPDHHAALNHLEQHGIAYSAAERQGVILTSPPEPRLGSVMYCIVAATLDEARAMDATVRKGFQEKP